MKLISHNEKVLSKTRKGPLLVHPTGKWRAVKMTVSDYDPCVNRIIISHSTTCQGEARNVIKVTGAIVRMGYRPGVCTEVFSLLRGDSNMTGLRTCLIHLHLPNAHEFFNKWKIEWTKTNTDSNIDLSEPEYHYKMISNKRSQLIALKIPEVPVQLKMYAIGKYGTMQAIGEVSLPHADGKHNLALQ